MFSPSALADVLYRLGLSSETPLKVAFSGGLDSCVLLHALTELREPMRLTISSVHIDHGLQEKSSEWARQCEEICAALGVPCAVARVQVHKIHEEGLEAAARRARYACLAQHLSPGEVLLTAQHRDDQAETMLLQLLRGAGVAGLAAMPPVTNFSAGRLARPLLDFTRHDLAAYAADHDLRWVEDPSNRDLRRARNFLRLQIFPTLEEYWPGATRQLARSARHVAEATELLDEMAQADCQVCLKNKASLSIPALLLLSPARRRNLIRYWLRAQGFQAPSTTRLDQIMQRLHQEPRTRHAAIRWPGVEVRRYRDALTAWPTRTPPDARACFEWHPSAPLEIPDAGIILRVEPAIGAGLSQQQCVGNLPLLVKRRQGGETCRLPGRTHRHQLKKLLQEARVPPWEREWMPLVYIGDELAAIGDRWVCEPYAARAGEPGWCVVVEEKPA